MKNHAVASAFAVSLLAFAAFAAPQSGADKSLPMPPLKAPLSGWQVWPAQGGRILPDSLPPTGVSNAVIRAVGARAIATTSFFALRSSSALDGVVLKVDGLANEKGAKFPEARIDIKIVKLWYQDANGWFSSERAPGEAILVPELLLHDDSLVKTDASTMENLVRAADGSYRHIKASPGGATTPAVSGFKAADDAPALLPLSMAANETRMFVLTLDVPADTVPGLYKGAVSVATNDKQLGHFDLSFRICEPVIATPTSRFSGRDSLDGRQVASGTYSAMTTTEPEQFMTIAFTPAECISRSTFDFLADSGIDFPVIPPSKLDQLDSLFGSKPSSIWVAEPDALAAKPAGVKDAAKYEAIAKTALSTGVKDIRVFVPSREKGDGLAADRTALDAVDATGARTWAHSTFETYTNSADIITSPFEFGLPQDKVGVELPPMEGDPYGGMEETDSRLVENWHAIGTPLYLAITLPAGIENYALWRRAVGLQCYYVGYEGFILPSLVEGNDPWNDWADTKTRSRTFLYPTQNGFVETLAWRGVADGVADVRYLSQARRLASTLRYPEPEDFKVDIEGRKQTMWLQWLDARRSDLDASRLDAIAWIEKLDAVRKAIGR